MVSEKERRARWILLNICLLGGALLTFIGVRYFLVPNAAARTFGVPGRPTGFELHYILGLRNVWLGLLAVTFALMREWRALALWFAGAVVVCFSDAMIAASSIGGFPQVAFHTTCGFVSAVLAVLCWRTARKAAAKASPMTL
jgi:hypothetical protein